MKKREANFGMTFRHWLKSQPLVLPTAAFELKQTTGKSLPFSDVQVHQIYGLEAVKRGFMLYKIPDDSQGSKPFDMFYMRSEQAYVVIKYPGYFCVIDVDDFTKEKENSKRMSLHMDRAKEIAKWTINC